MLLPFSPCFFRVLLPPLPRHPYHPAEEGAETAASGDRQALDALLQDEAEAGREDDDGTDLLHDDGGVGKQGPELVRLEPWVTLEALEKGGTIGVVVAVRLLHPEQLLILLFPVAAAASPAPAMIVRRVEHVAVRAGRKIQRRRRS